MRRLIETFIKHKLSIFKKPEFDPIQASQSNIENVYKPDQLLDSEEERDRDEDIEISILLQRKNHSPETFGFCSNKRRVKKVEF